MTEVAGETSDVFLAHGFTTEKYLREETIPALERGAAKAGRSLSDVEISAPLFIVTGNNEQELEDAKNSTRQQIAFYGSTPAYRGVLETELNRLSKEGKWVEMGKLIDDEVLDAFAVVGEPEQIASELTHRFGDVVQRVSFYAPYKSDAERWKAVFRDLKAV